MWLWHCFTHIIKYSWLLMILEWLMMIQWWLIHGDYMWLWHCFTHIIKYSWLLMILEWLMMIQWWLIHGDYMWLWHCFTHIIQSHYSVLVVIDDSRMVNHDSMVINSWWLYVIMALFYPHEPSGLHHVAHLLIPLMAFFGGRRGVIPSAFASVRGTWSRHSAEAPDASIARWINSGWSYLDNINL